MSVPLIPVPEAEPRWVSAAEALPDDLNFWTLIRFNTGSHPSAYEISSAYPSGAWSHDVTPPEGVEVTHWWSGGLPPFDGGGS